MSKKEGNTQSRITVEEFKARRKRAESLAKLGLDDDGLEQISDEEISFSTNQYSVEILGTDLVKPKKGEKSFTVSKIILFNNH